MNRLICIILILLFIVLPFGYEVHGQSRDTVSIDLAGDVLMDAWVGKQIAHYGVNYPWEKVKDIFQESDLVLVNLETSVGNAGKAIEDKSYTFRSDPQALEGLVNAGVSGVSIANNHILDYGMEGFLDTLKNLEKYDIPYAGGGRNKEEAMTPAVWEINGIKIGFLAFSRVIPRVDWYAGEKKPGIISLYDYYVDEAQMIIENAKKEVDFLIVSVHWGKELVQYPGEKEIDIARSLIEHGADVIMGHHPHVLQGVEFYQSKPIIYSLGNFVFSSRGKLSNQSMIFRLEICKEGIISSKIIPVSIVNAQPTPAEGKECQEIISLMNTLSDQWGTKFHENGEIMGNIDYVEFDTEVKDNDGMTEEEFEYPVVSEKYVPKVAKIYDVFEFMGYDYQYNSHEDVVILHKKEKIIKVDYRQETLFLQKNSHKLKGFFQYILVQKPLEWILKPSNWKIQMS